MYLALNETRGQRRRWVCKASDERPHLATLVRLGPLQTPAASVLPQNSAPPAAGAVRMGALPSRERVSGVQASVAGFQERHSCRRMPDAPPWLPTCWLCCSTRSSLPLLTVSFIRLARLNTFLAAQDADSDEYKSKNYNNHARLDIARCV